MFTAGNKRRNRATGVALLLLALAVGKVAFAAPTPSNIPQLFAEAESLKTVDNAGFAKLLSRLNSHAPQLSETQKWHLRYLQGWQTAYLGDNDKAKPLLESVIKKAPDNNLRMQATATLINVLGIAHRYEDAFQYLDQALDELPNIKDKSVRFHILGEAAQLLVEADQYDLAIGYANKIIMDFPSGERGCIGTMIKIHAEFSSGKEIIPAEKFKNAIKSCTQVGDHLAADTIRRDMASLAIQQNRLNDALELLLNHYSEVMSLRYQDLAAEYNALLADVYWRLGDSSRAEKFAFITVDAATKSGFTEPLIRAYRLLYQVERQNGNLREALQYHEKYMAADKDRLDDVREKALAYQIVKQQVDAKKVQLDELNKQNRILQLQQALDRKAMETGRLYIALLLTVLASIGLWLFRLKRSQLRFMQLARRDGLTGIFNRQHFVEEAELALRYAAKSMRNACLILIDLDHFKAINDTHGHVVGDNVLRRAVSICQRQLHSCDVFGRLGGEEFGILLPECSIIQAVERAEHIRAAIHAVPDGSSDRVRISASLGIASSSHYGHDLRRLLLAADSALYQAKHDGRNRVVVSMDDHVPDSPVPKAGPHIGNDTQSSQYAD